MPDEPKEPPKKITLAEKLAWEQEEQRKLVASIRKLADNPALAEAEKKFASVIKAFDAFDVLVDAPPGYTPPAKQLPVPGPPAIPPATPPPAPLPIPQKAAEVVAPKRASAPTIGEQIEVLRKEARWSKARLADMVKQDRRNVSRHIDGTMVPGQKTIGKYEAAFTIKLKRAVRIIL